MTVSSHGHGPPEGNLREVIEGSLARHFDTLRDTLREGIHEELQKFLDDFTGPDRHRHANSPSPPPRPRSFQPMPRGDASTLLQPPPPPGESPHSRPDGAGAHKWMSRHTRTFTGMQCLADDEDGSGFPSESEDDGPQVMKVSSMRSKMSGRAAKRRLHEEAGEVDHPRLAAIVPEGAGGDHMMHRSRPPGAIDDIAVDDAESAESEAAGGAKDAWPKQHQPELPVMCTQMSQSQTRLLAVPGGGSCVWLRPRIVRLVRNPMFDYAVCILIVLNAMLLGVQTTYMAERMTTEVPTAFQLLEICFGIIFTVEILLRVYVYRCGFFHRRGWKWNLFDCFVVSLQIMDITFKGLPGLAGIRIIRVLRLIRAIRLIRILRHINALRALVKSILASLASLGWTCVLLFLMIYMLSLIISQLVLDHRLTNLDDERNGDFQDLTFYYGTLPRTMLSLFQAVSGGLDWDNLVSPLVKHLSWLLAPLFSLYIAFTLLAMMNVVTGVFVESVLETTKKDRSMFMVNNVRELFYGVDGGIRAGAMDWNTFHDKLSTQPMIEFFKALDIDRSEATSLFRLLDLDQGGSVNAEEFLSGCLRLQGPAKAIDMALLISEVAKINDQLHRWT